MGFVSSPYFIGFIVTAIAAYFFLGRESKEKPAQAPPGRTPPIPRANPKETFAPVFVRLMSGPTDNWMKGESRVFSFDVEFVALRVDEILVTGFPTAYLPLSVESVRVDHRLELLSHPIQLFMIPPDGRHASCEWPVRGACYPPGTHIEVKFTMFADPETANKALRTVISGLVSAEV